MNKLLKTGMVGLVGAAMVLSGTANASTTRSASGLPRVAVKAIKRTAAPVQGAASNEVSTGVIVLGGLAGAAAVYGFVQAVDGNNNDSPGA